MLDFSCPACGKQYHADEEHIGKRIRCSAPRCEEIITIAREDGRCTNSNQQIKAENQRWPKSIEEIRKNGVALVKNKKNRKVIFVVIAFFLMGIGLAGYKYSVHRDSSKLKSEVPFTLSPDDVAGADAVSAPSQIQAGDQANQSNTASPISTGVLSPETENASSPKPISKHMPKAHPVDTYEASLPANSLPTGTRIIADQAVAGKGELEAINGTGFDACVIVLDFDTRERIRKIYIRSQDSFTLVHLTPGNYKVLFATGIDWDNSGEHFNRDASYFEFGKVLSFREEDRSHEKHTITLNPVANGNVHARSISEAEFHALTGKR